MKGTIVTIFSIARRLLDERGAAGARDEARLWIGRFERAGNAAEIERWRHVMLAIDRFVAEDRQKDAGPDR